MKKKNIFAYLLNEFLIYSVAFITFIFFISAYLNNDIKNMILFGLLVLIAVIIPTRNVIMDKFKNEEEE